MSMGTNLSESGESREDKQYRELQEIGKGAAESIAEMVVALECDYDRLEELKGALDSDGLSVEEQEELAELGNAAGECESRDDAEQRVHEHPLSVEVRGDWHSPSDGDDSADEPVEFKILLGTGGPATRIRGELRYGEPHRAWIEAQDWGTQWTEYHGDAIDSETLLTYCRCFYFGEG